MDKLIGFLSEAANSKTRRIPLESNAKVRLAIHERLFVEDEFGLDMTFLLRSAAASNSTNSTAAAGPTACFFFGTATRSTAMF